MHRNVANCVLNLNNIKEKLSTRDAISENIFKSFKDDYYLPTFNFVKAAATHFVISL